MDELVVAKGGSKLKETTLDPSAALAAEVGPLKFDKNGSPEMATPRFLVGVEEGPNGPTAQMIARAQTLSQLATELGNRLNHPVVDRTGLTGKYDFSIEYTPDLGGIPGLTLPPGAPGAEASEPGSNLAAAIEQQLGLRLVGGKAKLDLVVVDKAERSRRRTRRDQGVARRRGRPPHLSGTTKPGWARGASFAEAAKFEPVPLLQTVRLARFAPYVHFVD